MYLADICMVRVEACGFNCGFWGAELVLRNQALRASINKDDAT